MSLLDLIFPKFCVGCGEIGSYICPSCKKTIEPIVDTICPMCDRQTIHGQTHISCKKSHSMDGLISCFRYKGVIQKLIKRIKYQFVSDCMKDLVGLCVQYINFLDTYSFLQDATVVPIPLHPTRLRYRGFNQAAVFGKALAHVCNLSFTDALLRRKRSSRPQVEMKTKKERIKNINDMFEVCEKTSIPSVVLLVDDVFTTGATMRDATKALKRCGVKTVWGFTIAR
ncbi:MAG: ComF family protein [Patescibacteria group bacterium]|nr:ComF family protein [Patescibacteria group bacterium]